MAAWLCVVVVSVALARACWQLTAAAHAWRVENPSTTDVDAVLAHMEATYGEK